MKAHGQNALAVARWLSTRGKELGLVDWVVYPGLKTIASRLAGNNNRAYDLVRHSLLSPHARKWIEQGIWSGKAESGSGRDGQGEEDEGIPFGGMVSFKIVTASTSVLSAAEVSEPTSTASRFLTTTRLFTLAESLGGVESLAELPALMTHAGIPVETREKLGISSGLIRLSVGVEEKEDILFDLERALRWAVKGEVWGVETNSAGTKNVAGSVDKVGVAKVVSASLGEDKSVLSRHEEVVAQV